MNQVVNKTKPLLFIILVLLISNFALIFFFVFNKEQPHQKKYKMDDMGGLYTSLKNEVGFDTTQLNEYSQLRKEQFQVARPLFGEMRKAKENFYSLLYLPEVSDSAKNEQVAVIGNTQQKIDLQMFNYFVEIRKLCRPDQIQKFDSSLNKSIQRMTGGGRDRGKKPVH